MRLCLIALVMRFRTQYSCPIRSKSTSKNTRFNALIVVLGTRVVRALDTLTLLLDSWGVGDVEGSRDNSSGLVASVSNRRSRGVETWLS
jgi:hypothetical protein